MGFRFGRAVTSAETTENGAYLAFACGLSIWGWQLVSFYMGYLTGPRKTACAPDCMGWRRFIEAIRTSLYHELTVCLSLVVLVLLTWGQPNQLAVWTFLTLWWMHQSAKLNVFFGVPNLGEELLPDHLHYLRSFMARKPMNLLFPISVTISTIVAVVLVQKAIGRESTPFEATAFTMLATLMALAIAEHWFLVTPLPVNALWQWGVKGASNGDAGSARHAAGSAENQAQRQDFPTLAPSCAIRNDEALLSTGGAGLESWTNDMPGLCDARGLRNVLDSVGSGIYGDVESLKGVVRTSASWIRFEVADARASIAPFAPHRSPEPLVVAVGRRFDRIGLKAAFDACLASG